MILSTQFLLVHKDVIFVQTQDGLYNHEVTVDEALEQILEELMFLQRELIRWYRNCLLVVMQNE